MTVHDIGKYLLRLLLVSHALGQIDVPKQPAKDVGGLMDIALESYGPCPELPDLPNKLVNISLMMDPDEDAVVYVSGGIILTVPLSDQGFKYSMAVKRCSSHQHASCERHLSFEMQKMCDKMWQRNQSWTDFMDKFENIEHRCPIEPGTYRFDEAPLDASMMSDMFVYEGHWQIECKVVHEGSTIFCAILDVMAKQRRAALRK